MRQRPLGEKPTGRPAGPHASLVRAARKGGEGVLQLVEWLKQWFRQLVEWLKQLKQWEAGLVESA